MGSRFDAEMRRSLVTVSESKIMTNHETSDSFMAFFVLWLIERACTLLPLAARLVCYNSLYEPIFRSSGVHKRAQPCECTEIIASSKIRQRRARLQSAKVGDESDFIS